MLLQQLELIHQKFLKKTKPVILSAVNPEKCHAKFGITLQFQIQSIGLLLWSRLKIMIYIEMIPYKFQPNPKRYNDN